MQTIAPLSALPAITNPVLIDGWSQPGYSGTPLIELSGNQAGSGDGLTITGSEVTVRGLDINGFSQGAGIHVTGTGATGNWIYGNFLGTDPTGTQALPNNEGVEIDSGATKNLVGTNGDGVNDASERNLISGNLMNGVWMNGQGTDGNVVAGNLIGTSVTGDVALYNGTPPTYYLNSTIGDGVVISAGASGNRIGTDGKSVDDVGERNVIADSGDDAIEVYGTGTDDNIIAGNFIGTDVTGTQSLGIASDGVYLADGASSNWIGVNPLGGEAIQDEGNVISGNGYDGVQIHGSASFNVVAGNKIGTDVTGTVALGNGSNGVEVGAGCVSNTIGGATAAAGNLISGNGATAAAGNFISGNSDGVQIDNGSSFNIVAGNKIGTDITGTAALGNFSSGVEVDAGCSGNTIGGTASGAGNVISSNGAYGVWITGGGTTQNLIQGNAIGTDITGTVALANKQAGVQVDNGAANNTVGGLTSPADVFHGFDFTSATSPAASSFQAELSGPPEGQTSGGPTAVYRIDVEASGELLAIVHPEGFTVRLMILDSQGRVLVQSDGLSPSDPDSVIDQYVAAGNYSLVVESAGGTGTYTMTTTLTPASAPLRPIPAGFGPLAIVAGDFTGDGHLDLAVANYNLSGPGSVSVLLGNGDGTFQPPVTYAVGSLPDAIVAGDFSGDGHLDLAVANTVDNTVSVLLGNGDGTFQPQVTYAVGRQPDAIVAGDFSDDGHLDLAVTNGSDNTVSVLLGNGDGTFQPQVTYAVGFFPEAIVAGDFSGEGRTDLAVACDNGIEMLLGNGDGTFQATKSVVSKVVGTLIAGDFTGDGRTDLAVANGINSVSVLLSNGDGTFQPPVIYTVGSRPGAIVAGDFTGDGRIDLAVANGINNVSVLLGNGDGTFQPPVTYTVGVGSTAIVAGDFTGDGRTDLAIANYSASTVSVLLGNGDGTFQPQVQAANAAGPDPSSVAAGEFTGNGRTDLAVADSSNDEVSILLANGDGTFQPPVTYAVGSDPVSIVAGDFNGDGRTDLAIVNDNYGGPGSVSVLLGNGDGTFQPQVTYAVGEAPDPIVAGDFTGDDRTDLAVVNYGTPFFGGSVSVLLGNGDGTFQPEATYTVGVDPDAIVAGDFAGDGRTDLAVLNVGTYFSADTVSVLLGNGDGTFQPQVTYAYAVGSGAGAIVAGDFTGDGRIDLAVASQGTYPNFADTVSVLLGNGDGTFQTPVTYTVGVDPGAIVAGNFTGDGHLDLAVANGLDGTVSVLLGNGDGTFQPQVTYAVGSEPSAIVAGDFSGDGRTDLAVANGGDNTVSVLLGNGDGTFSAAGLFVTTPHATPLVADVNDDGTKDVLVIDGAGNILYRQGVPGQPGSFEPPVTVNPGTPSRDIAWVTNPGQVPVLATVDAHDNRIALYSYGDDGFVTVGSLATGPLPAQIIAADLNDNGLTDLVVRNAGDGTLSVFYGTAFDRSTFRPDSPEYVPPEFLPPVTIPVGLGVSDVQAVDTTDSGRLDLVVTNKLTGQVGIVQNLGDRTFGPLEPYRAGTGLSAIDNSSSPEVASLEATAGVAAAPLTPGGPTDLITLNSGSKTLGVLAGLGQAGSPILSGFIPAIPRRSFAWPTSPATASRIWYSSGPTRRLSCWATATEVSTRR